MKKRRVIPGTDSDEEEGGSVIINDTRGNNSRSILVAHCVHPAVPALDAAAAAATAAAAPAAATATATAPASSTLYTGYCCDHICSVCPICSCHYKLRASPAKARMELPFALNYPVSTSELLLSPRAAYLYI
jgi:hypothetical protein